MYEVWDVIKNDSLFIWNADLTGHPVCATSGHHVGADVGGGLWVAPCFGLSPHGKGMAGGEQEWDLQGVGPQTGAPAARSKDCNP